MAKVKILIAEDEELLRDLYEIILDSEFSCEFISVANGDEAIEILNQQQDIKLIISDYTMPKSNGGNIYIYNKNHQNLPFIFLSGGDISDYAEFSDFYQVNPQNQFFNKPFSEDRFVASIKNILENTGERMDLADNSFIKILLTHYAKYSTSASEVYLKLGDNKYTKIVNSNEENIPDRQTINHYLQKGIDYVYIKKEYFNGLLEEAFQAIDKKISGEKIPTSLFESNGIKFNISYEGLNSIGINNSNIRAINEIIDGTISRLLEDEETKEQFLKHCETTGFLVGHSLLTVYVAGKICKETELNFHNTMKRISVASFFHDYSLFELEDKIHEIKMSEITDQALLKKLLNHPLDSVKFLPESDEIFEETKKIILEHHEKPDGSGYPRMLEANQISSFSCLFIISEQIALCLIRNNFSNERLRDFLNNSEEMYSRGNFIKFYQVAQKCFAGKSGDK